MKSNKKERMMLLVSMAVFGTLAPFVRRIGVSSGELALYRAILAALLIGVFLLVTKQPIRVKGLGRELPLLLLSGMAMGINWILLFEAYKYTTVSAATLSYYFAPVIVTVVSPFLFKEKLTGKQILCFVMSTIGLVLVNGAALGGGNDLLGVLFGLGAAVFYACVILLNKFIKGVTGIHRTFLQFLSAIVILIPYVACTGGVTLWALDAVGSGRCGLGVPADRGLCPHGRYLLPVLLLPEGAAWPAGGDPQLHRPAGSHRHRRAGTGGTAECAAADRRSADSGIYAVE